MKILTSTNYQSPVGDIEILLDEETLVYLDFAQNSERREKLLSRRFGRFLIQKLDSNLPIHQMLDRYFSGQPETFEGLTVSTGGTEFQRAVWQELRNIKRGHTMDYASLAAKAGNAKAVRAAASSNARNPISIVIPCHRVIGKDGSMRGYAGGVDRKRFLLTLEGAIS
ncbi:MAG: methylated-DNA--[protein]-cysteine S-methyltransferase [Acidiferrobacterales bacterium]|nr:methylated-DNA--[protein]-cysteine S-methyltransferase [Acidiferrobacterales bacterium]